MKIVVATSVGKSKSGKIFCIFPSRWSWMNKYHTDTYYPFDLGYLSSMLKRDTTHTIKMVDGNYKNYTIGIYAKELIAEKPDVIVMETDSLTYSEDMELLRQVKASTGCKVIMVGAHPTAAPEQALADGADYVAIGEFQEPVVNLINSNFAPDIIGIHPNGRAPIMDVDRLPWPEDTDISRRDYCRMYACEYREIEVFPTRGCPVNCNYCVVRNLYHGEGNIRCRPVGDVVAEIKYLKAKYPDIEGFFFNEESHTANKKYIHQLCDALIESGLSKDTKFNCMCNFAALDRPLLEHMKRAGYYKVRFGVETLDTDSANTIFTGRWKKDANKLVEILGLCAEIGMKVYATMSVGTLGATAEKDRATLAILRQLYERGVIQEFQVSINTPMPGTPFFKEVRNAGWLKTENPADFDGFNGAVIDLPDYRQNEINEVFGEYLKFQNEVVRGNRAKGVSYSMYDEKWVAKVLANTKACEAYV